MSTRSILAIQKGNKVRYCFIHWDGDNHGQTLKEMLDSEIEEMFERMGAVEKGNYIYLDHLHSKSYWDGYIEAQRIDWQFSYPGRDMKEFERIYVGVQKSGYMPVVIEPKKDKDGNVIEKLDLDPDELGFYETTSKAPKNITAALNGNYPFTCCEYVWFYNIDTKIITWFHDDDNWKKRQMKRRKRLTPKKYDFSYIYATNDAVYGGQGK